MTRFLCRFRVSGGFPGTVIVKVLRVHQLARRNRSDLKVLSLENEGEMRMFGMTHHFLRQTVDSCWFPGTSGSADRQTMHEHVFIYEYTARSHRWRRIKSKNRNKTLFTGGRNSRRSAERVIAAFRLLFT